MKIKTKTQYTHINIKNKTHGKHTNTETHIIQENDKKETNTYNNTSTITKTQQTKH